MNVSIIKIAHILNTPIISHGGVALLAREIAFGLEAEFKTFVICPQNPAVHPASPDIPNGITVIEWNLDLCPQKLKAFLAKMLQQHGIQIAVFHGGDFSWGPIRRRRSIIAKVAGKKLKIITINHQTNPFFSRMPMGESGSVWDKLTGASTFFISWLLKHEQLYHTNVEVNVSNAEYRQSIRRYPVFKKTFKCIYHSRLSKENSREISSTKEKLILCVGHFAHRKGQHVLLSAFSKLSVKYPEWRLILVGGSSIGGYNNHLDALLDELKIRSQVHLVTETFEPDESFRKASIYVQPSFVEAYGLALQEAMAFGCACVGSKAGGIVDSITNPGYLFRPGDDIALAAILESLMADPTSLRARMSECLEDAARFNRYKETMLEQYRGLLAGVMTRK